MISTETACWLGHWKKIAKFLMRTFTWRSTFLYGSPTPCFCFSLDSESGIPTRAPEIAGAPTIADSRDANNSRDPSNSEDASIRRVYCNCREACKIKKAGKIRNRNTVNSKDSSGANSGKNVGISRVNSNIRNIMDVKSSRTRAPDWTTATLGRSKSSNF